MDIARDAIEDERWRFGSNKYCWFITLDVRNAVNSANWWGFAAVLDADSKQLLSITQQMKENRNTSEIEEKTNATIQNVVARMDEAGLTLTAHKTEAVLISGRKKVKKIEVTKDRMECLQTTG